MISEEEAHQLVKNTSKYAHALLVSAIMAEVAKELKEDVYLGRLLVYSTTLIMIKLKEICKNMELSPRKS